MHGTTRTNGPENESTADRRLSASMKENHFAALYISLNPRPLVLLSYVNVWEQYRLPILFSPREKVLR